MQASQFDGIACFRAVANSGARALLIGRRALIALGLPVHDARLRRLDPGDDAGALNEALRPFDIFPTRSPEEARRNGRHVIEGDEHVDVLVARAVSTVDGIMVAFEDVWQRRVYLPIDEDVSLAIPPSDDLILTKRLPLARATRMTYAGWRSCERASHEPDPDVDP